MKHSVFYLLVLLILSACSSNDEEAQDDDLFLGDYKKISFVKGQQSYDDGDQYLYENDKIKYIFLYNCTAQLHYYEYENNRINREFVKGYEIDFNPNNFDLADFKNEATQYDYQYNNDRLSRITIDNSPFPFTQNFEYDSGGKLIRFEQIQGIIYTMDINYNGEEINSIDYKYYDSNGNLASDGEYTFEFDDKINPLYHLSSDGVLSLHTCRGMTPSLGSTIYLNIFKHNIKRVFYNGALTLTSYFEYEDDYPMTINFDNVGGESDLLTIIY